MLYETYYTGRSTRQVALVLGVPPGTVKSRLHHAVRAMRTALSIVETADKEVQRKARLVVPVRGVTRARPRGLMDNGRAKAGGGLGAPGLQDRS